MVYLGLMIGFVCGFLFRGFFYKFKDNFEKFLKREKQEEISDELFVSYIKSFRNFNTDVLINFTKAKHLKSIEKNIRQDNKIYHIFDSYFESDNYIYLYRLAFSLMSEEELSDDNFSKDIYKLKEVKITNEQLEKLKEDNTIKKLYFKNYSCFPNSFLKNYYFNEKIFIIPTIDFIEREKKEEKKDSLISIKCLIQEFSKDIDDIEVEILTNELMENINIILEKFKKEEINNSNFDFFLSLLTNIQADYTLLWANFKNKKEIKEELDNIEFNLNILNDNLVE